MTIRWDQFEDYVMKLMEEKSISGVSVGISKEGKTIYEKGFGYRDLSAKEPVTPDTLFGIASITKSFTALAVMQLEEQGLLSVNDPVVKHLPKFNLQGIDDISTVKIHHLLSHTTGCPPMLRREDLNVLDEHLEYIANSSYRLLGNPGDFFSYCNDTFLLLGAIIERTTGKLFRRYVTEHILNPLEMNRSTFSIEEVEKYKDVSVPYDYNSEKKILEKKPWPTLGNYEVGGGIRSCARDLLKYGNLYIDVLKNNNSAIIGKSSIEKMFQPAYELEDDTHYGYALKSTSNYHGITLVEHGGGQPGVSSNFGFIPEKDIVVTVLCNVGAVPIRKVWLAAVNTLLGLSPELVEKKKITFPLSKSTLESFVGLYKSDEGSSLVVELHNNSLIVKIGANSYTLRPSSIDTLLMDKEDRPIKFFLTEYGSPWAAFWGMRMLRKQ